MSAFTYKFKSPVGLKANVQATGELFEELANTVGLTPKTVVEVSREPDSLLHEEFEWNNSIAAEKYREEQARWIIRNIVVERTAEEPEVRAFHSVIVRENNEKRQEKTFAHINTIVKSEDLMGQVMHSAYKDLQSFGIKYHTLREYIQFKGIFVEIDKIFEEKEKE